MQPALRFGRLLQSVEAVQEVDEKNNVPVPCLQVLRQVIQPAAQPQGPPELAQGLDPVQVQVLQKVVRLPSEQEQTSEIFLRSAA